MNTANMITLTEILSKLYADKDARFLRDKLRQHGLIEPLNRSISQLNDIIKNQNEILDSLHFLPVGHTASMLLHAINATMSEIVDIPEKTELENMLGDICQEILKKLFQSLKSDRQQTLQHIVYALKDTCMYYNYDFNRLAYSFKIDSFISYHKSLRHAEKANIPAEVPSYIWKGKMTAKKQLIDVFIERKLIKGRKNFEALFDGPRQSLQLKFDSSQADILLHLFYHLKKEKLFTPKGREGFYQVLEFHVMDFRKLFLKGQEPKRRINALRQNKAAWIDNQSRVEKWLAPIRAA